MTLGVSEDLDEWMDRMNRRLLNVFSLFFTLFIVITVFDKDRIPRVPLFVVFC